MLPASDTVECYYFWLLGLLSNSNGLYTAPAVDLVDNTDLLFWLYTYESRQCLIATRYQSPQAEIVYLRIQAMFDYYQVPESTGGEMMSIDDTSGKCN